MDRFSRRAGRVSPLVALITASALAVAACSSSHHGNLGAGSANGAVGQGTASGATSTIPVGGSPTTTAAKPSGTTRQSGTTVVPPHPGTAPTENTGSSPSGGSNGAPNPATGGTYAMSQSGWIHSALYNSSEPARGTLVVDPAQQNGTQVDHRYVDPGNSSSQPANTTTRFLPSGPVILSTNEGAGPQSISCTFNPPIAAPPWPPAVGKTFASNGDCGSGTTVTVQGRIAGFQTATLADGETFPVWIVDSTLNLTGNEFNASGTQVDWYSTALRLPVHEQIDVQGSYSGVQFALHSVSDLISSRPS